MFKNTAISFLCPSFFFGPVTFLALNCCWFADHAAPRLKKGPFLKVPLVERKYHIYGTASGSVSILFIYSGYHWLPIGYIMLH